VDGDDNRDPNGGNTADCILEVLTRCPLYQLQCTTRDRSKKTDEDELAQLQRRPGGVGQLLAEIGRGRIAH
jgi:hypothetical protein